MALTQTPEEGLKVSNAPSDGKFLQYKDSSDKLTWATPSGGLADLVSDTSPQLGGDLDIQARKITTSTTDGDITLEPNGGGNITVGTGSTGAEIQSNGTHNLSLKSSAAYISISGGANGSVQILPAGTGTVDLGGSTTKLGLGNTEQKLTTHMSGAHINIEPAGTSGNIKVKSGANEDIELTPNGTGDVVIDGLKYPQADGSAGQVLKTDGSAQLSWTTVSSGVASDGTRNTKAGTQAGDSFTGTDGADATDNTLYGYDAGTTISSGDLNTAVGSYALASQSSGSNATAVGFEAARYLTGNNCAVGSYALKGVSGSSNGVRNVAVGHQAMLEIEGGDDNTCVGNTAGYKLDAGSDNTFIGAKSGDICEGGGQNTAVGMDSLGGLSSGGSNVAVGYGAGLSISSAGYNTCIGTEAGKSLTTGEHNVAIGYRAMEVQTGCGSNVAVGNYALSDCSDGAATGNTAIGHKAGEVLTTAEHCTLVGFKAGDSILGGYSNTAVGSSALAYATTGNRCVAVGRNTLASLSTGLEAVALGHEAGVDYNANGGVFLGRWAGKTNATDQNTVLYIARNADSAGNNGTWIYGNDTGQCFNGDNDSHWATTSDQRLKKDIVDNNVGLAVINNVRVRNFKYKQYNKDSEGNVTTPKTSDDTIDVSSFNSGATAHNLVIGQGKTGTQLGVIAQELESVAPNCVRTDDFGAKTVQSDELIWNMINAIKELSAKVTALEAKVNG